MNTILGASVSSRRDWLRIEGWAIRGYPSLVLIRPFGGPGLLLGLDFGHFFGLIWSIKAILEGPMKGNQFRLVDSFIKGYNHELNTPISAILANIEMMISQL